MPSPLSKTHPHQLSWDVSWRGNWALLNNHRNQRKNILKTSPQPRPQGLLLDDFQNGDGKSSRRRPWGRGWTSPCSFKDRSVISKMRHHLLNWNSLIKLSLSFVIFISGVASLNKLGELGPFAIKFFVNRTKQLMPCCGRLMNLSWFMDTTVYSAVVRWLSVRGKVIGRRFFDLNCKFSHLIIHVLPSPTRAERWQSELKFSYNENFFVFRV